MHSGGFVCLNLYLKERGLHAGAELVIEADVLLLHKVGLGLTGLDQHVAVLL